MLFSDPFRELDSLLAGSLFPASRSTSATLPMDAWRDEEALTMTFEVPGVTEDAIGIEVDRSSLTVTVDKPVGEVTGDRLRSERLYGRMSRQISLGETLDTDAIEASLSSGVLTLRVPIAERAKPRRISIGGASAKELESSDA